MRTQTGRKDTNIMTLKLNIGSGGLDLPGYANIDIKSGRRAWPLDCQDESADEIRASHILEHFGHRHTLEVLRHWVSKLRPGGVLKVAVPDFQRISKGYLAAREGGEPVNALGYLMGGQTDQYDFHKALFDDVALTDLLQRAGLVDIKPWTSEINDCAALPISLNLQGTKPEQPGPVEVTGHGGQAEPVHTPPSTRIAAVMSMPRLAFVDNMNSVIRGLLPLGVEFTRGCGVFWGQVLTRMIEPRLEDGTEFLFTLDYDTWFTKQHAWRLLQLMAEHPEADAIIPMQIKREGVGPMFGIRDDKGQVRLQATLEEFRQPLVPVRTGHFGLTLFRMSAFQKLKRPWFVGKPGPDGRWAEDRIDEDIYFWMNFAECGLRAFLAPEVSIGHMQLLCTFPDVLEHEFRPIHVYTGDLDKGAVPKHCIPTVEVLR